MVGAAAGSALFGFAKNPSNGRNAGKIGSYRLYVDLNFPRCRFRLAGDCSSPTACLAE